MMSGLSFAQLRVVAAGALFGLGAAPVRAQSLPPIERLLAVEACQEVVMSYAHALDTTDVAAMTPLFTDDAGWEADGKPAVRGKVALRAFWADAFGKTRPTVGRHIVTNVRTAILDADRATGTAFITMFRFDPVHPEANTSLAPLLLVALDLSYRRVAGRWLFTHVGLKTVAASGYEHGKS